MSVPAVTQLHPGVTCGIVCITVIKTWSCDAAYSPGVKITRSWHITWSLQYTRWHDTHHLTRQHWLLCSLFSADVTWCLQREMFTVPGSDRDWVLGTAGLRRLGGGSQITASLHNTVTPATGRNHCRVTSYIIEMEKCKENVEQTNSGTALLVTFQDEA